MIRKTPYYGYPLSSIFTRMIAVFLLYLFTISIIVLTKDLAEMYFIFLIVLLILTYFILKDFKSKFLNYRNTILKKMMNLADIDGNEKILDMGTGAGWTAIKFAKHLNNHGKVYGIDRYNMKYKNFIKKIIYLKKINFIGNGIKNARKNAEIENVKSKCEFITADLTHSLAFPDKYFDIIISSQFLYCLPKHKMFELLNEMDRCLKKDGILLLFEVSSSSQWNIYSVLNFFKDLEYENKLIKIQQRSILMVKKSDNKLS